MISYGVQTIVTLGIFYVLFSVFSKGEKTFKFNRCFLLITLISSLILPFISVVITQESSLLHYSGKEVIQAAVTTSHYLEDTSETVVATFYKDNTGYWLFGFYLSISLLFMIRLFRNIVVLWKKASNSREKFEGMKLVRDSKVISPYSFFNVLYIPQNFNVLAYDNKIIVWHEKAHYKQLHSLDVIFIELVCCFIWFNPFSWLYRELIKQNHEYLADTNVVHTRGVALGSYAQVILNALKSQYSYTVSSGFNFHQSKKRIVMLQKSKSKFSRVFLKLGVLICLVGLIMGLSSFKVVSSNILKPLLIETTLPVSDSFNGIMTNIKNTVLTETNGHISTSNENFGLKPMVNDANVIKNRISPIIESKTFVVLVDPGHGGKDLGHDIEKSINLTIAKELAKLSNDKVKIVLTRETDKMLSLEERVAKANSLQPNLFLSLHCNSSLARPEQKGIELFYSEKNIAVEQSYGYCIALIKELLTHGDYEEGALKKANFIVLRETQIPAIMLEMGFLTNKDDRQKLTDTDSQKLYAKTIFESLESIAHK